PGPGHHAAPRALDQPAGSAMTSPTLPLRQLYPGLAATSAGTSAAPLPKRLAMTVPETSPLRSVYIAASEAGTEASGVAAARAGTVARRAEVAGGDARVAEATGRRGRVASDGVRTRGVIAGRLVVTSPGAGGSAFGSAHDSGRSMTCPG